METYVSSYTPSEIRDLILQEEQAFSMLSKGEITETSFQFYSKENPPGMVRGKMICIAEGGIHKTKISISTDAVDYEKGASMLLYVFSYLMIAIAFIILAIHYPTNLWVYVITGVACFLPPPLVKLYYFFESSPSITERTKEEFLKRIKAVKA